LITQWHQDHVGGNEYFAKAGAILVAHEKVHQRLSNEQYMEFFKAKIPALPASARPAITFSKDVIFHMKKDDISAFNLGNAHTDGDAIVYFKKSNVIHMGDIFFNGIYPFIDLSAAGTINGMIEAVQYTLTLCNSTTRIIPGHGPVSDKTGLEAYLDMLVKVRDRIANAIKEDKSLGTIIAERPTADYDQKWGKGFLKSDQFVQIVYSSLRKDQPSCGKKP
jgi:glyoxylase-like metal-dependent hydrolase (beta-lactamase superfamily II)